MILLPPPTTVDFYIGTYTDEGGGKGIYRSRLDVKTGGLGTPVLMAKAPSPSYLALAPNGRTLYAVHESEGTVGAYRIESNRSLQLLNVEPSRGSNPCHIALDPRGRTAFVANYGGSLAAFPLMKDGKLGPAATVFKNTGAGTVKGRQDEPHMHSVGTDPAGRFLYACDLGTDEVLTFRLGANPGEMTLLSRAKAPEGAGPRHFALGGGGRLLYANNEIRPSLTTFSLNAGTGGLKALATIPSVRGNVPSGTNTAEIALHPTGRWLYVSNRTANTIAVFKLASNGIPSLVETVSAGVREPRGFALDPTGRWLVAAGQRSNSIATHRIDLTTGRLKGTGKATQVGKPVCILFDRS